MVNYVFIDIDFAIVILLISTFNALKQSYQEEETMNQKFNNLIISPPNIETNPNEEIVYVPTPIDPFEYAKLRNEDITQGQQPNFLQTRIEYADNQEGILDTYSNRYNSTELNYPNKANPENIEKMIKLQEKDYQKYFDTINKMEYQKVYQDLNSNQMQNLYNEMEDKDNLLNYNNVLSKLKLNYTNGIPLNTSENVVNLPLNQKEMADMYSNVFNKINLNNSLSFDQTNTEIMKEEDNQRNTHNKNKDLKNNNYPRFMSLTHNSKTKEKNEDNKDESSIIHSFLNNNKDKLAIAVDKIIKNKTKKLRSEVKNNLNNCNSTCDKTCKRASQLKKESLDLCKAKCNLACCNNAINILLK